MADELDKNTEISASLDGKTLGSIKSNSRTLNAIDRLLGNILDLPQSIS